MRSETQRPLLREQLAKVGEPDAAIERLDAKVAEPCHPFAKALAALDRTPGVNARDSEAIVPEVGLGNRQTAGESQGGKARKGNGWPRQALVEAGWAASRSKGASPSATCQRLGGPSGRRARVPGGRAPHPADGAQPVVE